MTGRVLLALLVLAPMVARAAPLFTDAELDAMLAAHRWTALAAALDGPATPDDAAQGLRWMQSRLPQGGFALASLYARNLFAAGSAETDPNAAFDLLTSAALVALYAEALLVVDGPACQNPSAALDAERRWREASRDIVAVAHVLAPSDAEQVEADAIGLEQRTASRRPPDEFLCHGAVLPAEQSAPRREQARARLAEILAELVAGDPIPP